MFSRKYSVDVTVQNESRRAVITDSSTLFNTYVLQYLAHIYIIYGIVAETALISVSDRL